jgi:hypothetical protein
MHDIFERHGSEWLWDSLSHDVDTFSQDVVEIREE